MPFLGFANRHLPRIIAAPHAMKTTILLLSLLGLTYLGLGSAAPPPADDDGREIYINEGCNECHGIEVAGIEPLRRRARRQGPDLSNLGAQRTGNWLGQYLKKEVELEGKAHKKKFKGSDEELQVLVDWLLEQKSE